ncbi:helix-hairpin-helix domain-containing protein [Amygdalobacter nucleatus]|uniref:ComEA protein n=1 Tax=Amygdalobacter nucleatus TaxID=3029274 RepID=A0A133YH08_9FIRM|nr:helix-hairpin-helix domain-containing protein [Amygdalobacter nucleatus]KXB42475.1 comEA protein [Amygdalobacter nucleatus]MDF0486049.1 helix-hairpin-helix domain-containing protein [Amygdalobacter nucleatus]
MKRFYLQHRSYFFIGITVILLILLLAIYRLSTRQAEIVPKLVLPSEINELAIAPSESKLVPDSSLNLRDKQTMRARHEQAMIQVDLKGEVKQAGIYKLTANANLAELIAKAGGCTEEAAVEYLNLAMPLKDKELYRIPSFKELASLEQSHDFSLVKPGIINVLPANYTKSLTAKARLDLNTTSLANDEQAEYLVNINSCSEEELAKVPKIGPKLAKTIINYRMEQGNFLKLEDLLRVKGIKDKKLKQIRARLTCN